MTLPNQFEVRFWEHADGRSVLVREIRRRVDALKADSGADSTQKLMLVQRTVFIAIQLESMERAGVEYGKLDLGRYTQGVNALLGLLKALGLEKRMKSVGDLKSYLNGGQSRERS